MEFTTGLGKQSEQVLLTLRGELEQGRYPLDSQMPTEGELCRRFGTSRTTIRRALERLAADGSIEQRRGSGTFARKAGRAPAAGRVVGAMLPFAAGADGERQYDWSMVELQERLLSKRFLLCVCARSQLGGKPELERTFLERVLAERHHGLIANLTPTSPVNDDIVRQMDEAGIRVLHVEPYSSAPPRESYLLPDYVRGGYLAATTLLLKGFKRLVFVGTDVDWPSARLFRQGFADALDAHLKGYDQRRDYIESPTGCDTDPKARRRLERLLANHSPGTAFVCRSVSVATEVAGVLSRRGLRRPKDFDVVGATYFGLHRKDWSVASIEFDRQGILSRAVELLTADSWGRIQELVPPRWSQPVV